MNKINWTIYVWVSAIVIGGYYLYSEYNKHQFSLGTMDVVQKTSIAVVLSVFTMIVAIAYLTVSRNIKLYNYLKRELEQLEVASGENEVFTEIKKKHKELVVDDYSSVNIPAFLESYMAGYEFTKNKTVPKEIKLLQANTSTPILIGVLGTFVGLVVALSQLKIGDASQAIDLTPILNGVGTAFYTSITGVLFALLIGLNLRHFNSDQLFIQHMLKIENLLYRETKNNSDRAVVDALVDVKSEIINMRTSFVDVANFSKEFKKASDNLQSFNKDFEKNITGMKEIFGSSKDVMELFNERTAQFHEDFENLFNYFKSSDVHFEKLEIRHENANKALEDSFKKIHDFQDNAVTYMQQLLIAFQTTADEQLIQNKQVATIMENVGATVETQFDAVITSQKELATVQESIGLANKQQIDVVEKTTLAMNNVLENSNFDQLTDASRTFGQHTSDVKDVMKDFLTAYEDMRMHTTEHYKDLHDISDKLETLLDQHDSTNTKQAKEMHVTIERISKYQEDLQQAVLRFLKNDFDYDKLRNILDEVNTNMEIQNKFLLEQIKLIQQPQQVYQIPQMMGQQPPVNQSYQKNG